MDPLELTTIARWAGGKLIRGPGQAAARAVSTDSRAVKRDDLFVALSGGKYDGHAFLADAARQGAVGAVAVTDAPGLPPEFGIIQVDDTLRALQETAYHYRRALSLKAVAITGSNGKTSTKDFTAAILSRRAATASTEGNLNNHIGLPLTIMRAESRHQFGIFEIGMNHPGEIAPLARLVAPDAAIITNIGVAHIEFMGSRDAIAREKGVLAEAVGPDGFVVLAADDDYSEAIAKRTTARTIFAGIGKGGVQAGDLRASADGTRFRISAEGKSAEASIAVPGEHMVRNAILAVAAALALGLCLEECVEGLSHARPAKGRLEQRMIRGIRVIDDSYNANPDSVIAALKTLAAIPAEGRRIAVLGKMGELGTESESGHRLVGEAAGREEIECVLAVGAESEPISRAAREHGVPEVFQLDSAEAAASLLRKIASAGDVVLIKGSRSERMERIVEAMN